MKYRINRYPSFTLTLVVLLLASFAGAGCSTLTPVTWKERVEKQVGLPSLALHYKVAGKQQAGKEVLLLLHGFGESSFTWRYLVNDLAKEYRVISLDLKGFGNSPKPRDGRYSVYDQALAVRQFIEQQQLRHVTLIGHSLGGGVALALALMSQTAPWHVDHLVVIGAAAYAQNLPSMLEDLRRPVIGEVGVYLVSPHYQARKAYEYSFYDDRKIPHEGVLESARNFARPGSRYVYLQSARQLVPDDISAISRHYRSIQSPTLIVWGYEDQVVPRRYALRLHKAIPDSQLAFIHRAGHMPQEEKPEQTLQEILRFLKARGHSHPPI